MSAPQVVMLVLWAMSFGVAACRDGEPRTGNYSLIATGISILISYALLYWGGFFAGAPA
jgi:uncharacterized lipoprotein YehR (DUF1307 family)